MRMISNPLVVMATLMMTVVVVLLTGCWWGLAVPHNNNSSNNVFWIVDFLLPSGTTTITTITTINGHPPSFPTTTLVQQQQQQQQQQKHSDSGGSSSSSRSDTSSHVVANRAVRALSKTTPSQQQQQQPTKLFFGGKWIRWILTALFKTLNRCDMEILSLQLIGTNINRTDLKGNRSTSTIYVTKPTDDPWFTIDAIVNDCPYPTAVEFTYNGQVYLRDRDEPFNLCGNAPDDPSVYDRCEILARNLGTFQTVTATFYRNGWFLSIEGNSMTVSFTIVPYTVPARLLNLVVVSSSQQTTTPATVNVTTDDVTVQFELTVLPQTTLRFIRLTAYNPDRANTVPFRVGSGPLVPYATSEVSVDVSSGKNTTPVVVTLPITFKSSIHAGMSTLEVVMIDTNSVVATVTSKELQNRSLPYAIVVQDANDDLQPPNILSFEVLASPSSFTNGSSVVVDVSAGSEVMTTFRLQLQDTFSGLVNGTMIVCNGRCFGFSNIAKYTFQLPSPLVVYNWTIPITMNTSLAPKRYEFQLYVYDAQSNVLAYTTPNLTSNKWPSSITLVNSNYDTTPPRLINIVGRSPTIRLAQARKFGIPFLITVQDDIGLSYYASGDVLQPDGGVRRVSMDIPQNVAWGTNPVTFEYVYDSSFEISIGTFSISEISLSDTNGNYIRYGTNDLIQLGIDSRVEVVR